MMSRRQHYRKLELLGFNALLLVTVACGARSGLEEGRLKAETGDGGGAGDAGRDVEDAGPDMVPYSCEDAGVTYIYIMTEERELFRFYPPDLSFTFIGPIKCPAPPNTFPFSMAVDRKGIGYVLFGEGDLFAVSTAT